MGSCFAWIDFSKVDFSSGHSFLCDNSWSANPELQRNGLNISLWFLSGFTIQHAGNFEADQNEEHHQKDDLRWLQIHMHLYTCTNEDVPLIPHFLAPQGLPFRSDREDRSGAPIRGAVLVAILLACPGGGWAGWTYGAYGDRTFAILFVQVMLRYTEYMSQQPKG